VDTCPNMIFCVICNATNRTNRFRVGSGKYGGSTLALYRLQSRRIPQVCLSNANNYSHMNSSLCVLPCMRACLVCMQTREVTLLCFANANVYTQHNACIHTHTHAYGNPKMAACGHINLHLGAKDVCFKTLPLN